MGKGLKGVSNGGTAGATQVDDLKIRILASEPGTGDVARHIQEARFSPRRNAFTSLIQVASKSRQPEKAIEIFEAMKAVAGIPPNTYSYSALISALARVGQWEQAEQYFNELKGLASDGDPDMQLNTVTYAAMISAYEKGGQLQKALDTFEEQIKSGVEPDVITYASLVNACERAGDIDQGLSLIDQMHKKGFAGSQQMYMGLIAACGKSWEKAVEIFLGMQCAGVQITPQCVNVMMGCLCAANQKHLALDLLQQAAGVGWILSPMAYISLLRMLSNCGLYQAADYVHSTMLQCGFFPDAATAGMLVYAHTAGGDLGGAFQLELQFKNMGILPAAYRPNPVEKNIESEMLLRYKKTYREDKQSPRQSERFDSGSTSSRATCTSDVRNDEDS